MLLNSFFKVLRWTANGSNEDARLDFRWPKSISMIQSDHLSHQQDEIISIVHSVLGLGRETSCQLIYSKAMESQSTKIRKESFS